MYVSSWVRFMMFGVLLVTLGCRKIERPSAVTAHGAGDRPVASETAEEDELVPLNPSRERLSNDGTYYVAYTSIPEPIPLNQSFDLDLNVLLNDETRSSDGDLSVTIDARMPSLYHGMNRVPQVLRQSKGKSG